MSKWAKKIIIVVACPDRGAGNDPEPLMLAFHQGPTFINAYRGNDLPQPRSALSKCFVLTLTNMFKSITQSPWNFLPIFYPYISIDNVIALITYKLKWANKYTYWITLMTDCTCSHVSAFLYSHTWLRTLLNCGIWIQVHCEIHFLGIHKGGSPVIPQHRSS